MFFSAPPNRCGVFLVCNKNDIAFAYDSNGNLVRQSNGLVFLYDHTGVFAVKYDGSAYFYRKDVLGNVYPYIFFVPIP